MTQEEHGQDYICLLYYLMSINDQGMVIQEERIRIEGCVLKVPHLQFQKVVILGMNAVFFIVGDIRSAARCHSSTSEKSRSVLSTSSLKRSGMVSFSILTVSVAYRKFSRAIRLVNALLFTTVVYSSGPVTALIQNFPSFSVEKKPRSLHKRKFQPASPLPPGRGSPHPPWHSHTFLRHT